MVRRIIYVAAVTFCTAVTLSAPAVPAPKEREPAAAIRKDTEAIQGTWYTVSSADRNAVMGEDKNDTITYEGNRWSQARNGQVYQSGTFEIVDATSDPKQIDFLCTEGQQKDLRFRAIYRFRGDALDGCSDHGENSRPTEFDGQAGFMHVAKRVKK